MIGDAIAGWIGNKIDRRDGKGGTLGAIAGVLTWKATKRIVPAALVLGAVAYGAYKLSQNSNPPV
jgi:hypothetical protein|nr:hypothetical protein [uncultured Sphingomonas sp.]